MSTPRPPRYPTLALLAAVFGSLLLLAGGAAVRSQEFSAIQASVGHAADLIQLRGEVLRLDEVLTMSAQMAAATGDMAWAQRYDRAEQDLALVLDRLQALGIGFDATAAGSQTDSANDALVAIERQALSAVQDGELTRAQQLMNSPRYDALKAQYSDGMAELLTRLAQAEYGTRAHQEHLQQRMLGVDLITTLALLLLWLNFARLRRRHHDATVKERSALHSSLSETTARFRTVLDHAPVVVFALDTDGTFEYSDGAGLAQIGLQPGEVVGQSVWDLYADAPHVLASLRRCLDGEPQAFVSYVGDRWFRTVAIPVERDGRHAAVGVSTDVTKEIEAQRDAARFTEALNHSALGLALLDEAGRVEHASAAFERLTGQDRAALAGRPLSQLVAGDTDQEWLERTLHGRRAGAVAFRELQLQSSQGQVDVRAQLSTVALADGLHHVVAVEDLTDQHMLRAALHEARLVDPDTGLPNRRALLDRLASAPEDGHRLYYVDLDHFHRVNEALEPAQSAHLLRTVAQHLGDAAPGGADLYRVGGDELVIHHARIATPAHDHVGDALREAVAQTIDLHDRSILLTASVGIADMYPEQPGTPDEQLRRAESAMYSAKRAGRNCCRVFHASLQLDSQRALQVESRLRDALQAGTLAVHYQPVIRLADGMPCAAEALLRWTDDTLGAVSPAEFVPIAEQVGLAAELGNHVFSQACDDLREWNRRFGRKLTVALNCAADQLAQDDFVQTMTACNTRCGIDPSQFELEITERVFVTPSPQVTRNLKALRQLGFRVALDDFGTGYSALSYLRNFDLDTVKLDRSFVEDIERPSTRALSDAIVAMGHALGMTTIAEGIETPQQAETLKAMGCALAQGFHYTPALPHADFMDWVEANTPND